MKFRPSRVRLVLVLPLLFVGGCVPYAQVREVSRTSSLATTPGQRALVAREAGLKRQPLEQLGGYVDAANETRLKLAGDPKNRALQSDYNFAVARVMDVIKDQKLAPWERPIVLPSATGTPWRLRLTPPSERRELHPSRLTFTPADRYVFKGQAVAERVVQSGLGAPIVVTGKDIDYLKADPFAQGKHIYYGLTAAIRFHGRNAEIVLLDPLEQETVTLDRTTWPLSADYTGSLALALSELEPKKKEILGLFKPQKFEGNARLARLQPFDRHKIPVLLVHGLGNSPAIWTPLIQSLRGDARIRRNYQFWFFAYPSGLPYPLAAAELRRQLALIRKQHPEQKDAVVIGHSMGGMISRLLVTDSGRVLWNAFFDRPPEAIPLSPVSRRTLVDSLIFKPVPRISRVVFVSASHRGSKMATDFWGRVGSWIIGNPVAERNVYQEAIPYARPSAPARKLERLPNSIDLLAPDNYFVTKVDSLPLKKGVPYHSLIGDRGKGGSTGRTPKPLSSDGIVPYWSSHMPGARSEEVIPSGHWSQLHPDGVAEIKRILLLNLRE